MLKYFSSGRPHAQELPSGGNRLKQPEYLNNLVEACCANGEHRVAFETHAAMRARDFLARCVSNRNAGKVFAEPATNIACRLSGL